MVWNKWDIRAIGKGTMLSTWAGMEHNVSWENIQQIQWGLWFITVRTTDTMSYHYQKSYLVTHLKIAANAKLIWVGFPEQSVAYLPTFKAGLTFCFFTLWSLFSMLLASNSYSLLEPGRDFNRWFYWIKPNQSMKFSAQLLTGALPVGCSR